MNRDLIVYSGVSAAIIACFGLCTWQLTRQAQALEARMDVMDKRLGTLHDDNCAMAAKLGTDCGFDLATARPVQTACAATDPPPWCKDPNVAPTHAALAE